MNTEDQKVLDILRAETRARLLEFIGSSRAVSLLDFPWHQNVGDAMIWAGELEYLRSIGVKVRRTSDIAHFDAALLKRSDPSEPILLHGGGNFGDVWPRFQDFRLRIVAEFTDRKIVQLPQTVHFTSPEGAIETNAVLGAHPDFTLLVRDQRSLDRSRELLPQVNSQYCYDMALGWAPPQIRRRRSPYSNTLSVLQRQDREATRTIQQAIVETGIHPEIFDWGLAGSDQLKWKRAKLPGRVWRASESTGLHSVLEPVMSYSRSRMLRVNLNAGVSRLASSRVLLTDRLHAHILAVLLGIPHLVVDNSYGKIFPIFEEYTGRFSTAKFATEVDQVKRFIVSNVNS